MNQRHIRLCLPLIVCILAVSSGLTGKEPKPIEPDGATGSMIGKEAGHVRDDNSLKMKLHWCPPGTFVMGDYHDDGVQRDKDGNPKPDVTEPELAVLTRGFWIGSCEVTQSEWSQLMESSPWRGKTKVKEGHDFPASYISFDDAAAFCRKLTDQERQVRRLPDGWEYSLPTEALWECACRAGSETRYCYGKDESLLDDFAWSYSNTIARGEAYAHRVGQKKANAWGLCDMHGNVWEWCRDHYAARLPGGKDPEVRDGGSYQRREGDPFRVIHGGCYHEIVPRCRSGIRQRGEPEFRGPHLGFRVALNVVRNGGPAASGPDGPGPRELGNEKKLSMLLRFVGGPKNEPLAGMKVKITSGYSDKQKSFGSHTTDETGTIKVSLPPAFYELELSSDKELPYLPVEMLWNKGSRGPAPDLSLNVTKTGVEKCLAGKRRDDGYEANVADGLPRITYTLLPACELTLRALDVETGEGLPGAEFYKENDAGEDWARAIEGENIGTRFPYLKPVPDGEQLTNKNGNFRRLIGANHGFVYGVWKPPAGYEEVESSIHQEEVRWGQARAELIFKFRRIRFAVRLEPEKKRIKLGEPLTLDFTVTNRIAESRGLQLGGDDRNRLGRPASFKVTVTKSFEVNDINHDHKMPIPDAGPSSGGISSNVLLKPNGETTVKLKLSDWATITRPGSYRVYVERTLKLFPVKAQDGDRIEWSDAPETERVKASCDFDVVAADEQSAAERREFKSYKQKIHNTEVSFEMVAISGGEFTMGSPDGELGRGVDEGPQHRVRVPSFWMGKCEVTWDEFELWLLQTSLQEAQRKGADRSPLDTKADAVTRPTRPYADLSNGMGTRGCPAICISQHAAKKYCEWLSARTGLYYRLPTEAEWEYACRAGTTTAYSFGDDPSRLDAYAWHDGNCDVDGAKKYHPVGLKKPNPWGLHDMHGNVAEWVQDKYEAGFYKALPANQVAESPLCIARLEYPRVTRGGSWMSEPSLTRSAVRQASTEKWKESDPQAPKSAWYITDAPFVGFRVVRPLRPPTQDERKSQHLDAVVPTDVVERRLPGD